MSPVVIVVIAIGVVLVLFFVGGLLATRRRTVLGASGYARHVAEADHALEQARAADRGWDRDVLEEVARRALAAERPGWSCDELFLVLVDDRPGVTEDRAQYVAAGPEGELRLVLERRESGWVVAGIE